MCIEEISKNSGSQTDMPRVTPSFISSIRFENEKKNRDNDLSTYENRDNSNGNGIVAAFRKTKQEQKRFENVLNFGRDDRSLSDKQKNRFINSKTHVV